MYPISDLFLHSCIRDLHGNKRQGLINLTYFIYQKPPMGFLFKKKKIYMGLFPQLLMRPLMGSPMWHVEMHIMAISHVTVDYFSHCHISNFRKVHVP